MIACMRLAWVAVLLACASGVRGADEAKRIKGRVLVDSVHAHNYLKPAEDAEAYSYHIAYGHRKAFGFLQQQGVSVEEIKSGRLDGAALAKCDVLFINLVSAELPPFYVSEIQAIKAFIETGGSLFVITDHTNCYYHTHKLAPLMDELGIKLFNESACEKGENALSKQPGWITITRFEKHAVTTGLSCIAFQAGGTVDDRFAVAKTSDQAWGDQWQWHPYGQDDKPGFYGNWLRDGNERHGPLGVVLAKELGKGRIVIVADQNLFGDPFINYADNYKLFFNVMAAAQQRAAEQFGLLHATFTASIDVRAIQPRRLRRQHTCRVFQFPRGGWAAH